MSADKVANSSIKPFRLYYLDWLRVIAIFCVFLFHSVHVFDLGDWHIKNAEQSLALTVILTLLGMWGMPFFFMIAGTGSWFALRRRTPSQYASERFKRLVVPFVFGALLFMPVMLYFEWMHLVLTGQTAVSFVDFAARPIAGFTPRWFGILGYHLWYLGFLFSFAVLSLPLFLWWKTDKGQRLLAGMAALGERRGAILLFILPLTLIRCLFMPLWPMQHDWGDFFFLGAFFVLGFVLFSDPRFAQAIRRDWWVILGAGVAGIAALSSTFFFGDPFAWGENPRIPEFYLVQFLVAVMAVSWSVFMIFIGMRFLQFTNNRLQYAQRAVLPFFVIHQPAIMVVAFFVVQWDAGIPLKAAAVICAALAICLGLYEFLIRRVRLLQSLFGMTAA